MSVHRPFAGPHPGLRRQLEEPAVTLDFAALPMHWRRTLVVFTCARPAGLEDGPWLPTALRGAWGRQLLAMALAQPDAPADPFNRARAIEALFRTQAQVSAQLDVPKPWVIRVDTEARVLIITLTLFGFAGFWRKDARDAMLAALARGLPLKEGGRLRVPYPILDCQWGRSETVAVPEPPEEAVVRLRTPLCLRASGPLRNDLDDFVPSLANRLRGLARWQGVGIESDRDDWREPFRRLTITVLEHGAYAGRRFSSAQPGRAIPHTGLLGAFRLRGPLAPLLPLLALGETAHAGARTAFGFGAYDLLLY